MTDARNATTGTTKARDPADAAVHKRKQRDRVRIVAAVVIVALLVAFVLDNSHTVQVGFVFFTANVSLIWALLIAAFLGALADRLLIWRQRQGRKAVAREARRKG